MIQKKIRKTLPRQVRWLGLIGLALLTAGAHAQSAYPTKPIRLIVAFGPGSVNDAMARELAKSLYESLGQTVVVENKPGAGGITGTDFVARAAPDGYTLGFGTSSQLVMNVGLYKKLAFDVDHDIKPIGLVSKTPLALVVKGDGPATLSDLVKQAKAKPDSFTFASSGVGSINHISGEAFARQAAIKIVHVPYKGATAAAIDLAGGRVDMMLVTVSSTAGLAEQGKVRVLASGQGKRNPAMPDVPTFSEAGLPGYDAYTWNNLFAPAKTPPEIMQKLNVALNRALVDPAVVAFASKNSAQILGPTSLEQALLFEQKERATWVPLIRGLNIEP